MQQNTMVYHRYRRPTQLGTLFSQTEVHDGGIYSIISVFQ